MTKASTSHAAKKTKFKPLIIGVAIFGGISVLLFSLLVSSIVWGFSSEPDEAQLEKDITSKIKAIQSARVSYGHSGAPWNNNLSVWLQVSKEDTAYELVGYTKEVSRVILDSTKGTPNYQVSINYVVGSVGGEESVSFVDEVDPRYNQKVCDVFFKDAYCKSSIQTSKSELEKLF